MRLVAILTDGPGDGMLLEDANDLAEWKSRRPEVVEGRFVIQPPVVPPRDQWIEDYAIARNEDILGGFATALGL